MRIKIKESEPHHFYILLRGKVNIKKYRRDDEEEVKDEPHKKQESEQSALILTMILEQGNCFGDSDIIHDKLRSQTVKCKEDCHFAYQEKENFNIILKPLEEQYFNLKTQFLCSLPCFSGWTLKMVEDIIMYENYRELHHGEYLFQENEESKFVAISIQGRFFIYKKIVIQNLVSSLDKDKEIYQTNHQSSMVSPSCKHRPFNSNEQYLKSNNQCVKFCGLICKQFRVSLLKFFSKMIEVCENDMLGEDDAVLGKKRTYSVRCEDLEGGKVIILSSQMLQRFLKVDITRKSIEERIYIREQRFLERISLIENNHEDFQHFLHENRSSLKEDHAKQLICLKEKNRLKNKFINQEKDISNHTLNLQFTSNQINQSNYGHSKYNQPQDSSVIYSDENKYNEDPIMLHNFDTGAKPSVLAVHKMFLDKLKMQKDIDRQVYISQRVKAMSRRTRIEKGSQINIDLNIIEGKDLDVEKQIRDQMTNSIIYKDYLGKFHAEYHPLQQVYNLLKHNGYFIDNEINGQVSKEIAPQEQQKQTGQMKEERIIKKVNEDPNSQIADQNEMNEIYSYYQNQDNLLRGLDSKYPSVDSEDLKDNGLNRRGKRGIRSSSVQIQEQFQTNIIKPIYNYLPHKKIPCRLPDIKQMVQTSCKASQEENQITLDKEISHNVQQINQKQTLILPSINLDFKQREEIQCDSNAKKAQTYREGGYENITLQLYNKQRASEKDLLSKYPQSTSKKRSIHQCIQKIISASLRKKGVHKQENDIKSKQQQNGLDYTRNIKNQDKICSFIEKQQRKYEFQSNLIGDQQESNNNQSKLMRYFQENDQITSQIQGIVHSPEHWLSSQIRKGSMNRRYSQSVEKQYTPIQLHQEQENNQKLEGKLYSSLNHNTSLIISDITKPKKKQGSSQINNNQLHKKHIPQQKKQIYIIPNNSPRKSIQQNSIQF